MAAGADLVVQSAHKTLPSLTQTAWLHLNGPLADPAAVERELDVFETSSPSYPLLASLDGCTAWLAETAPPPLRLAGAPGPLLCRGPRLAEHPAAGGQPRPGRLLRVRRRQTAAAHRSGGGGRPARRRL